MPPKSRPRTKKKIVIAQQRGDLGESSTSQNDDSDINETDATNRNRRNLPRATEAFHSPEIDSNATDYGLEFTTSRIRSQDSPRRCSTLNSGRSQDEQSPRRITRQEAKNSTNNESQKQDSSRTRNISPLKSMNRGEINHSKTTKANKKQPRDPNESGDENSENDSSRTRNRSPLKSMNRGEINHSKTTKANQSRNPNESSDENNENEIPEPTTSAALKNKKATKAKPKGNQQKPLPKDAKKPRKQKAPQQLNVRFLRDVRLLQNTTNFLIPRLPFARVVREIIMDCSCEVTKITTTALEALQTASEMYVTQRLQDAYMLTLHRGRVTLDVRDLEMINYLKASL
ncbi:centromere identifier [Haematobia irritans]|uniref:centromere identifier n=1 Tax=Haematobia irritans TaxID=7368 RepID=UPI003F5068CF